MRVADIVRYSYSYMEAWQRVNRHDFFCNLYLFRLVNFLLYWGGQGSLIDISTTQSNVAKLIINYCISQGSIFQAPEADSLIKKQSLLKRYWVAHRVIEQAGEPGQMPVIQELVWWEKQGDYWHCHWSGRAPDSLEPAISKELEVTSSTNASSCQEFNT